MTIAGNNSIYGNNNLLDSEGILALAQKAGSVEDVELKGIFGNQVINDLSNGRELARAVLGETLPSKRDVVTKDDAVKAAINLIHALATVASPEFYPQGNLDAVSDTKRALAYRLNSVVSSFFYELSRRMPDKVARLVKALAS